jgi:hypothetical protein
MDIQLLEDHIKTHQCWESSHQEELKNDLSERQAIVQSCQMYTKKRILAMTEEDIYEYLSPLWAMLFWGNKQYIINKYIADNSLPKLKQQLANLIWGDDKIENRWDEFRKEIKGIGTSMMSELLCKTHPEDFMIWNRRTLVAFDYLGIDELPRYDYQMNGNLYAQLCEKGKKISEIMEQKFGNPCNLLFVDYFFWKELQVQTNLSKLNIGNTATIPDISIPSKDADFVHNDIRDKIAEIGSMLGFHTETEKLVAAGARIDALWEFTIGNMGRVIYGFEVQTAGSINSLILNLMKIKKNKAVQGIVAVSDKAQIEKIKKEVSALPEFSLELKYWDYLDVLKVHEALLFTSESINNLGLVSTGF